MTVSQELLDKVAETFLLIQTTPESQRSELAQDIIHRLEDCENEGIHLATYFLAVCYRDGIFYPKDEGMYIAKAGYAARHGVIEAAEGLALFYLIDKKSWQKAEPWVEMCAKADHPSTYVMKAETLLLQHRFLDAFLTLSPRVMKEKLPSDVLGILAIRRLVQLFQPELREDWFGSKNSNELCDLRNHAEATNLFMRAQRAGIDIGIQANVKICR